MEAPDPEGPRPYRPPGIPELGTEEARERIKRSGVPLDEWVDMTSPQWKAQMAEKRRREERDFRVMYVLIIGLILAIALLAPVLFGGSSGADDGYAVCHDERGAYAC
jgi:hypothetical protein